MPDWLRDAVLASALPEAVAFPRSLADDIHLSLPLSVEPISRLSTHGIRTWLRALGIRHDVAADRRLHGCLVANAGAGVVFVDSEDDAAEQRFTLAHEASHFVLDHQIPRQRALRAFGESILPVLDGERPPTPEEALSAVLDRVPIGLQVHLMGRDARGGIADWSVEESEQRADLLALELLAPAKAASRELRLALGTGSDDLRSHAEEGTEVLARHFGLPPRVARSYCDLLASRNRRRRRLSDELLGDG